MQQKIIVPIDEKLDYLREVKQANQANNQPENNTEQIDGDRTDQYVLTG